MKGLVFIMLFSTSTIVGQQADLVPSHFYNRTAYGATTTVNALETRERNASPGGIITIKAWTLENLGDADATLFDCGVYLSTDMIISANDDILIHTYSNISLNAGGSIDVTEVIISLLTTIPIDDYFVGVFVDTRNVITEPKTNNTLSTLSAIHILPVIDADLEVLPITTLAAGDPSEIPQGRAIDIAPEGNLYLRSLTIRNNGPENATSFSVAFYLSEDQVVNSYDKLLGTIQFPIINHNSSVTLKNEENNQPRPIKTLKLPDVRPGAYYLLVFIDKDNDVLEGYGSAERNNYSTIPLTILNLLHAKDTKPIWRVQVSLKTCDRRHSGTDDGIRIRFNDLKCRELPQFMEIGEACEGSTWLNSSSNDFERGGSKTYDVLVENVNTLADVRQIRIEKEGSDDWCVEQVDIKINQIPVFQKKFAEGKWVTSGAPLLIHYSDMRHHSLWTQFRVTENYSRYWDEDPNYWNSLLTVKGNDLESLIEAYVGNFIHNSIKIDLGSNFELPEVDMSELSPTARALYSFIGNLFSYIFLNYGADRSITAKLDWESSVHVNRKLLSISSGKFSDRSLSGGLTLNLELDNKFDRTVDIGFDINFCCKEDKEGATVTVSIEKLQATADTRWFGEAVTLGLAEIIDQGINKRFKKDMNLDLPRVNVPWPSNSCPKFVFDEQGPNEPGNVYLDPSRAYGKDIDCGNPNVKLYKIGGDGRFETRTAAYEWSEGWSNMEAFEVNNSQFVFCLKQGTGFSKVISENNGRLDQKNQTEARFSEGWTHTKIYRCGANYFLFMLKENGRMRVRKIDSDGKVDMGMPFMDKEWSSGWSIAEFYYVGTRTFLFLLKESTGAMKVRSINDDGTINDSENSSIMSDRWSTGWKIGRFYKQGNENFILLIKAENGTMAVRKVLPDGKISIPTFQSESGEKWKGWTDMEFYLVPGNRSETLFLFLLNPALKKDLLTEDQRYLFELAKATMEFLGASSEYLDKSYYEYKSAVKILKINSNGKINSSTIWEEEWTPGWSNVSFFTMSSEKYAMIVKKDQPY
jgi:hypothetical protein